MPSPQLVYHFHTANNHAEDGCILLILLPVLSVYANINSVHSISNPLHNNKHSKFNEVFPREMKNRERKDDKNAKKSLKGKKLHFPLMDHLSSTARGLYLLY